MLQIDLLPPRTEIAQKKSASPKSDIIRRKLKGRAHIRLPNGNIRWVELHWYEAHGVGRKDIKIKRYLE